jgi:hypothetical protein
LDASDPKSYPGSGTVWYDRSGNGYDARLVDVINNQRDSIKFNGASSYAWLKGINYGGGKLLPEMSCFVLFRTDHNSNLPVPDGSSEITNWAFLDFDRSDVFNFSIDRGGQIRFTGNSSNRGGVSSSVYYDIGAGTTENLLNDGKWHYAGVTFSVENQEIVFYIDSVVARRFTANGNMTPLGAGVTRYGIIGDGSEASTENGDRNNAYYDGEISKIHFYEKALSESEVLQNYNAIKSYLSYNQTTFINTDLIAAHIDVLNGINTQTIIDSGIYNNNATFNFTPTVDTTNYSLSFNGVNQYGAIADSIAINSANFNKRTIEIWFKTGNNITNRQLIYKEGGLNNCLGFYVDDGNIYIVGYSETNEWDTVTFFSSAVEANTWYHACLVLDIEDTISGYRENAFFGYLNGTLIGSGGADTLHTHTADINIGGNIDGFYAHDGIDENGNYFTGSFAILKIYNEVLNANDILISYLKDKGRFGL